MVPAPFEPPVRTLRATPDMQLRRNVLFNVYVSTRKRHGLKLKMEVGIS